MKWGSNKITENQGLIHVMKVVNDAGSIFTKIDGSNDIGLDGQIEIVRNGSATGFWIGVQIKSGDSNKLKSKIILKSDKEHFEYWQHHTLPIAGIVYIPEDELAYWVDITGYLNENEQLIQTGPYNIPIHVSSIFSQDSFQSFVERFASYKISYNTDWHFGRALTDLVPFKSETVRADSIKSLFSFHRDQKEAWYYLIHQFRAEESPKIQGFLIHIYKYLLDIGDIFWHRNNYIPQEVCDYGKSVVRETFSLDEVRKLMNHIDEMGITRGAFGVIVHALIDLLPNKIDLLIKFIRDPNTADDQRCWAAIIVINCYQRYDIERAINFAESMRINFPKSEHAERFTAIKDYLSKEGFFDFVG
jgi:hypothetical protein